jgi:arsenate reductase-like glutaredoxin family protein
MPPQRAKIYSYGNDEMCAEAVKFITDAGVVLDLRDLEKQPMDDQELRQLIGNLEIIHFLNPLSPSYSKHKLDEKTPGRDDLIKLMLADHTLIRRPIIKSSRLLMIGCDKRKIRDMLQINENGEAPHVDGNRANGGHRGGRDGGGRDHRRGSRKSVGAGK